MKLKKIASACLIIMGVLGIAGCSSSEVNPEDVTLTVNIWDPYQQPGIQEILDGFTEQTGIKTSLSVVTWTEYWSMLEAGAQGGQLPDVFLMHSNESQRYMENDMLLDLTEYIDKSEAIKLENYPSDIWNLYISEEKIYGVPKDIDTIALWYNKTMFDEAGLEYPNLDWTWEDMTEAGRKLTKSDGSQYGIAMRNDTNQEGYYNIFYSYGGDIINEDKTKSMLDDPKTIEAMQILETWIKEGLMPSLATLSETPAEVLMQSGQVAMALHGSWMLPSYKTSDYAKEHIDIAELPKSSKTGERVSVYNGLGWAAAENTEYPEQAWQLIEYLGSEPAQLKQAELGVTMSAFLGTSDTWINSAEFNLQAYLNMMDNMVIRPYSRNTVIWENDNNEALKAVYTGEKTMEAALKEMAAKMNETLANE